MSQQHLNSSPAGILLIDKPIRQTSFSLVAILRRLLKVKKIGHSGTLDPFATGVMVMLIGREYTRLSDRFLSADKEYEAQLRLGISTDTYDCEGLITQKSSLIPSLTEVEQAISQFQGEIMQIPPMFSAKKQQGKKLYELARQGKEVERLPVQITVKTDLLDYQYPYINIRVNCSKGTYIRSIGHDLGNLLGCGAHLTALKRTRSGSFHLKDCFDGALLQSPSLDIMSLQARMLNLDTLNMDTYGDFLRPNSPSSAISACSDHR